MLGRLHYGHGACLRAASASDEVHDDGDDGEEYEQVDEEAADVKHEESTEPENHQDNCENKEHSFCFLTA